MTKKTIKAADLFCGAGGASTGLRLACEELGIDLRLIAVNHWDIAIQTHKQNHPHADSLCTDLNSVDPRKLVPSGKLHLLIAAPECTHHSNARGGKPISDQSRASAWRIIEWASQIEIDHILVENVKEFQNWGPLGTNGRPLKSKKGAIYNSFLNALKSLGYTVEVKILNAADYGDPTSRQRLFIQARKGRKKITWPEPTHIPRVTHSKSTSWWSSRNIQPHRTAREIIDWTIEGESIYTRKRPLSPNTVARIYAGLRKFCGLPFIVPNFGERGGQEPRAHSIDHPLPAVTGHGAGCLVEPFLVKYYGGADAESLDKPLPAITANYEHYGLCQPFIVVLRNNDQPRSIDEPLATICANGTHQALCQPFIVELRKGQDARSLDEPLSTIMTKGMHHALCQPFLVGAGGPRGAGKPQSVDAPLGTVLTDDHRALIQPYIVPLNHGSKDRRSYSLNKPFPTVTSVDAWGLVQPQPFVINSGGREVARDVDQPLNTVLTRDHLGLVQSFLVKYNGTGGPMSVDEPLDTVTAKDRFGKVDSEVKQQGTLLMLDIRFRMLQPHELAAAMSFPKSYIFHGNREQRVKQIGNAWPVKLGKALCKTILTGR